MGLPRKICLFRDETWSPDSRMLTLRTLTIPSKKAYRAHSLGNRRENYLVNSIVWRCRLTNHLTSAIDNRKEIYAFLARTYATEASVEYLRALLEKGDIFFASAQDPALNGTDLAEGFKQLANFASSLKRADLEKVRVDLAVEYAGLFLGLWGKPAHPSESYYLTEGQLIMQQPRDHVLRLYRAMGVDKAGQFKEPEDHIAVELQFMAHLCAMTTAALKDGNFKEARKYLDAQKNFLDEHLGKWVPKLASDILKSARHEFYKAIAKITKAYVDADKELVADLEEILPQAQVPN